jgi:hypothetical protein
VLLLPGHNGRNQAPAKVLPFEISVAGEREGDGKGGALPFASESQRAVGARRAVGLMRFLASLTWKCRAAAERLIPLLD